MSSKQTAEKVSGFIVREYADISTAHVEQNDADMITRSRDESETRIPGVIAVYDEGWFIYIPSDLDIFNSHITILKQLGFSKPYLDVMWHLRSSKIPYARFDADGEINQQLPVFER